MSYIMKLKEQFQSLKLQLKHWIAPKCVDCLVEEATHYDMCEDCYTDYTEELQIDRDNQVYSRSQIQ